MTDWKIVKLGDLCEFVKEKIPVGSLTNESYISTENLLKNKRGFVPASSIPKVFTTSAFKVGDVLVSNIRPYFKKILYATFNGGCSNDVLVFRAKKDIEPKFLYYVLSADRFFDSVSVAPKGTKMPRGDKQVIMNYSVQLPTFETQKKIAAVLSALDDKIELNNAINKNLEEQAQAIYKNMFVDNLNPAWRKCSVDEVFNISIGKTPPRKEHQWFTQNSKDITWVSISDMGSCGVYIGRSSEYLTAEAVKKFNVKKVPRNTVILSFKLTVGRVAITGRELTTNEAIAHFITNDSFMTEYLYLYLKNFSYRTMGSTSSIATAINSKIIKAMPFILPTEEELCIFHNLVEPLFLMILQNQHENKKLCELRDLLLPRLMSGEIDVSNVEI